MDNRRLPLFIFGSLIGLVVLTVCAAPPPRGTVQNSQAQPTITSVSDGPAATALPPIPINDTLVKRVRALQTVPIFGGPSKQYVTVGVVAKDATVAVTGISVDGNWWRVPCDVRSQIRNQVDCWVEADPAVTGPVDEPAPLAPAATETAVLVSTATEAAPVATNTSAPVAPTATEAVPVATNTAVPAAPTATEAVPVATNTSAPAAPTATKPAPAATATKAAPAPTATKVPPTATTAPTPLPSPTAAPPTPTSQAIDLKPTNIQYIITLLEVQVLDAPQSGAAIGSYPAGKKIEVTGYTSADGLWWRVICPKGNAGNCFVTADPTFTSPAVAPK